MMFKQILFDDFESMLLQKLNLSEHFFADLKLVDQEKIVTKAKKCQNIITKNMISTNEQYAKHTFAGQNTQH